MNKYIAYINCVNLKFVDNNKVRASKKTERAYKVSIWSKHVVISCTRICDIFCSWKIEKKEKEGKKASKCVQLRHATNSMCTYKMLIDIYVYISNRYSQLMLQRQHSGVFGKRDAAKRTTPRGAHTRIQDVLGLRDVFSHGWSTAGDGRDERAFETHPAARTCVSNAKTC